MGLVLGITSAVVAVSYFSGTEDSWVFWLCGCLLA